MKPILLFNFLRHLVVIAILFTGCFYFKDIIGDVISSQKTWFLLFAGLLLVLNAIELFFKENKFQLNLLDLLITLFFLWSILLVITHKNEINNINALLFLGLGLIYYNIKRAEKSAYNTILISSVIAILTSTQIVIGVLQWNELLPSFNGNFHFTGMFRNPAPYSIFLASLMAACFSSFLYHPSKTFRFLALGLFIAGIPIIILSLSRATWIGLLMALFVIVSLKFKLIQTLKAKIEDRRLQFVILLTGALIFVCAYFLYTLKKDSADGRILIWKISAKVAANNILTGVGPSGFPVSFIKEQASYFKKHPEQKYTEGRLAGESWYAFNDFLHITTELGVVGCILFIGFLFLAAKGYHKLSSTSPPLSLNWIPAGAIAIITVIIFSGLFSYPLSQLPIQILFFSALAIISKYGIFSYKSYLLKPAVRYLSAFILLFLGIYLVNYSHRFHKAYSLWYDIDNRGYEEHDMEKLDSCLLSSDGWFRITRGEHYLENNDFHKAIYEFNKAKKLHTTPQLYYKLAESYIGLKDYAKAESQYKFVSNALPDLLRPRYLLAKLYLNTGQKGLWKKQALEVITFKSKVVSDRTIQMQEEIKTLYYSAKLP